jgi:hypothetical protein
MDAGAPSDSALSGNIALADDAGRIQAQLPAADQNRRRAREN